MTQPIKQITWTIIATLLFYVLGRLASVYFYRWTIDLVQYFSWNDLTFFGEFPYWFFHGPTFGLIFCSIPFTITISFLVLKTKFHSAFIWTLSFYIPILILLYLLNCYGQSIQLIGSYDFYKTGKTLTYNLREIRFNQLFLNTILFTTMITALINFIKGYLIGRKRQPTTSVLQKFGRTL